MCCPVEVPSAIYPHFLWDPGALASRSVLNAKHLNAERLNADGRHAGEPIQLAAAS